MKGIPPVTTTEEATPTRERIYARYRKGADLELHVKVTWVNGLQFVNLRDYVPSTQEYGKGVLFPIDILPWVLESLQQVAADNSTSLRAVGGQQSLPGI